MWWELEKKMCKRIDKQISASSANKKLVQGFSLTEVLMAVGVLSIGIMLVATMFPVALYLTTVASEKTMAAIVADQAFAKMQLYGYVPQAADGDGFVRYKFRMVDDEHKMDPNEFIYLVEGSGQPQYSWEALCRKLNSDVNDMRYSVKLFVSRKTAPNLKYIRDFAEPNRSDWPLPIVAETEYQGQNRLKMKYGQGKYLNPPPSTTIVDYNSGRLFRIVSREAGDIVILDRNWDRDINHPDEIWYVPSAVDPVDINEPFGNNPDIEVFQRIIDFKRN